MTQRKNADGSPRHTYVKAGENIVGLTLPGVAVPASASGAPRYAMAMADEPSFDTAVEKVRVSGVKCFDVESHQSIRHSSKRFSSSIPTTTRLNFACAANR